MVAEGGLSSYTVREPPIDVNIETMMESMATARRKVYSFTLYIQFFHE